MVTEPLRAKAGRRDRITAALGMSWRKRVESGQAIDLPTLDFGWAQLALLPAESFVAYQLAAQRKGFVMTAGFGECAPGYIPTDQAESEGFVKEHGYSWVGPNSEETLLAAIDAALMGNGK